MVTCKFCGIEIQGLPFKCRFCEESFCKKHRLPENHNCSIEFDTSDKLMELDKPKGKKASRIKSLRETIRTHKVLKDKTSPRFNATLFLYIVIAITSIIALFLPNYLYFYPNHYLITAKLNFWTIFTPMITFFVYHYVEFGFLLIFFIISYRILREFEFQIGSYNFLLIYFMTSILTGVIDLIGGQSVYLVFPHGFAIGGLLGLILGAVFLDEVKKTRKKVKFFGKNVLKYWQFLIFVFVLRISFFIVVIAIFSVLYHDSVLITYAGASMFFYLITEMIAMFSSVILSAFICYEGQD